jgi:hypothetical protein
MLDNFRSENFSNFENTRISNRRETIQFLAFITIAIHLLSGHCINSV